MVIVIVNYCDKMEREAEHKRDVIFLEYLGDKYASQLYGKDWRVKFKCEIEK